MYTVCIWPSLFLWSVNNLKIPIKIANNPFFYVITTQIMQRSRRKQVSIVRNSEAQSVSLDYSLAINNYLSVHPSLLIASSTS
uniref:Uncharacterized protein n=1 Tax=Rhizophora mucronata TaxID=61149 RepID=A0A2P2KB27_RHIMU